jgi:hypothetical protein
LLVEGQEEEVVELEVVELVVIVPLFQVQAVMLGLFQYTAQLIQLQLEEEEQLVLSGPASGIPSIFSTITSQEVVEVDVILHLQGAPGGSGGGGGANGKVPGALEDLEILHQ